jgi:hypothetical protein
LKKIIVALAFIAGVFFAAPRPASALDRINWQADQQVPSAWLLQEERDLRIAFGVWIQTALGNVTTGFYENLSVTGVASTMNVVIGPTTTNTAGALYQYLPDDVNPFGGGSTALAADPTKIFTQGIFTAASPAITLTAPSSGNSQVFMIECQLQPTDETSKTVTFESTTGNLTQGTVNQTRSDLAVCQSKAGTAATTGTQVAPTVDTGWLAIANVTVPSTATSSSGFSIAALAGFAGFQMATTTPSYSTVTATTSVTTPALTISGIASGYCLQSGTGGSIVAASGACGTSASIASLTAGTDINLTGTGTNPIVNVNAASSFATSVTTPIVTAPSNSNLQLKSSASSSGGAVIVNYGAGSANNDGIFVFDGGTTNYSYVNGTNVQSQVGNFTTSIASPVLQAGSSGYGSNAANVNGVITAGGSGAASTGFIASTGLATLQIISGQTYGEVASQETASSGGFIAGGSSSGGALDWGSTNANAWSARNLSTSSYANFFANSIGAGGSTIAQAFGLNAFSVGAAGSDSAYGYIIGSAIGGTYSFTNLGTSQTSGVSGVNAQIIGIHHVGAGYAFTVDANGQVGTGSAVHGGGPFIYSGSATAPSYFGTFTASEVGIGNDNVSANGMAFNVPSGSLYGYRFLTNGGTVASINASGTGVFNGSVESGVNLGGAVATYFPINSYDGIGTNATNGGSDLSFINSYNSTTMASFYQYNGSSYVQRARIDNTGAYLTGSSSYGPTSDSINGSSTASTFRAGNNGAAAAGDYLFMPGVAGQTYLGTSSSVVAAGITKAAFGVYNSSYGNLMGLDGSGNLGVAGTYHAGNGNGIEFPGASSTTTVLGANGGSVAGVASASFFVYTSGGTQEAAVDSYGNWGISGNYYAASRREKKTDITNVPFSALAAIEGTHIYSWCYKVDKGCLSGAHSKNVGPMANEANIHIVDGPKRQAVNVNNATFITMQAVKELYAKVKSLEEKVYELEHTR